MKTQQNQWPNGLLLLAIIGLTVFPLMTVKDSEFGGADGQAEEAITEVNPQYEPWFEPILEPPGGETESLLFALQAAFGAGIIGYGIGWYRGRSESNPSSENDVTD
ncbi:energy-coupling factor ABC transporter substrate-binding protein [Roseofilum sp. BLCC_M154]|uniref:Cobalt transport protein CbiN n=1 Tax=Roseofilum acuticapitatum BLCC-M154 TaxID=3022444 RepID=A0ABT7B252_9CYAN|nr:energy-coupling factor ABC transporter substrate-binding protein [Roseofilum acuticapitatum]MDJ1172388.1 energy-coupling factor ABC transporter substrate-binding protein [Roseofilum acuticapitatum BLCC-M154]